MNFDESDLSSYSRSDLEEILLGTERKYLKLVALYDDAIRVLEMCRDMICEECADGQYTHQADSAAEVLKQADEFKNNQR